MQTLVDRFMRGWHAASPSRHVQKVAAGAVDFVLEADESGVVLSRLDYHSARAVAKQNAGRAVGVIDNARHRVSADDEDFLVGTGRNEMGGRRQSVDKAR